jgi:hypothetical protein
MTMTMRCPAMAIGYGIWCRNQKGYKLCAAALAAMAIVYPAVFARSTAAWVLIASTIPLLSIFAFVLNSAIFAEEPGSLSSRYPRHMLVLPVKTSVLVFWPMLYGASMAVALWVVTTGLLYRSVSLPFPIGLPALALVVVTSWFQALAWLPVAVRPLREVISIISTLALGFGPVWIIRSDPSAKMLIVLLLLAYLPPAWFLGLAAVRADRRGEIWRLWFFRAREERSARRRVLSSEMRPFRSAPSAQFWYEWKCHGRVVVPALCAMMTNIWLFLLVPARRPIDASRLPLIFGLLIMAPTAVVVSLGPWIGWFKPFWGDRRFVTTFLTTRPLASGTIVAAKLRMALVSILLSWVYILAGTVGCIVFAFGPRAAITAWQQVTAIYPGGRAYAVVGIGCVLIPAFMWKQLTDGVPSALTGRQSIAAWFIGIYSALLMSFVSGVIWLANHTEHIPLVLSLGPWLVGVAVAVKTLAAVLSFHLALRRRLIGTRAVWTVLASWLIVSGLAIGLATLVLPSTGYVSRPGLCLGIATIVPLVRFPLSTLAFDWNRHR